MRNSLKRFFIVFMCMFFSFLCSNKVMAREEFWNDLDEYGYEYTLNPTEGHKKYTSGKFTFDYHYMITLNKSMIDNNKRIIYIYVSNQNFYNLHDSNEKFTYATYDYKTKEFGSTSEKTTVINENGFYRVNGNMYLIREDANYEFEFVDDYQFEIDDEKKESYVVIGGKVMDILNTLSAHEFKVFIGEKEIASSELSYERVEDEFSLSINLSRLTSNLDGKIKVLVSDKLVYESSKNLSFRLDLPEFKEETLKVIEKENKLDIANILGKNKFLEGSTITFEVYGEKELKKVEVKRIVYELTENGRVTKTITGKCDFNKSGDKLYLVTCTGLFAMEENETSGSTSSSLKISLYNKFYNVAKKEFNGISLIKFNHDSVPPSNITYTNNDSEVKFEVTLEETGDLNQIVACLVYENEKGVKSYDVNKCINYDYEQASVFNMNLKPKINGKVAMFLFNKNADNIGNYKTSDWITVDLIGNGLEPINYDETLVTYNDLIDKMKTFIGLNEDASNIYSVRYVIGEDILGEEELKVLNKDIPSLANLINDSINDKDVLERCSSSKCDIDAIYTVTYPYLGVNHSFSLTLKYTDDMYRLKDDSGFINEFNDYSLEYKDYDITKILDVSKYKVKLTDGSDTIEGKMKLSYIDENNVRKELSDLNNIAEGKYSIEIAYVYNETNYAKRRIIDVIVSDTTKPTLSVTNTMSSDKINKYDVYKDPKVTCSDASSCEYKIEYYYEDMDNEVSSVDTTKTGTYYIKVIATDKSINSNSSEEILKIEVKGFNNMNKNSIIGISIAVGAFVIIVGVSLFVEFKGSKKKETGV